MAGVALPLNREAVSSVVCAVCMHDAKQGGGTPRACVGILRPSARAPALAVAASKGHEAALTRYLSHEMLLAASLCDDQGRTS